VKLPPLPLLKAMESDLPCEARPFLRLAERFGISEAELLEGLTAGLANGLIRRFGARISHQEAGFNSNVMVVWQVHADEIERVGAVMAAHPGVTHCYERPAFPGFPYNLYTMIHGRSAEECQQAIDSIASRSGISSYRALRTTKEFEKSTPTYSQLLTAGRLQPEGK